MDVNNSVWSNLTSWIRGPGVRGQSEPPSMDGEAGALSTIPMADGANLQPVLEPLTSTHDDDTASMTSLGLRDLFTERRVNFVVPEGTPEGTMGLQHYEQYRNAAPIPQEELERSSAFVLHCDDHPEDQTTDHNMTTAPVTTAEIGYRYTPPTMASQSVPKSDPLGWNRMFNMTPGAPLAARPPAPAYELTPRPDR
jgi:hypothetical protein